MLFLLSSFHSFMLMYICFCGGDGGGDGGGGGEADCQLVWRG
jgi:hypothetical protein